jgi:hypothetical protein
MSLLKAMAEKISWLEAAEVVGVCDRTMRRMRKAYLNMLHFLEKLRDEHSIELSYTWVQQALQGAGLVAKRKKRGPHRRRRPRRPMAGMLLHIDGTLTARSIR